MGLAVPHRVLAGRCEVTDTVWSSGYAALPERNLGTAVGAIFLRRCSRGTGENPTGQKRSRPGKRHRRLNSERRDYDLRFLMKRATSPVANNASPSRKPVAPESGTDTGTAVARVVMSDSIN